VAGAAKGYDVNRLESAQEKFAGAVKMANASRAMIAQAFPGEQMGKISARWFVAAMLAVRMVGSVEQCRAQEKNSATFDADGTAHVTRVIRPPATISPEAQKWLDSLRNNVSHDRSLEERRKGTDAWRASQSAVAKKLFPVNIQEQMIGGVRCDVITPLETPAANKNRVLINLHGGGFNADSGSLIEGDPIANLAKIKVVSVYYRLAPENPFPAAVDDVVAVYKELLKTYKPKNIGIFGTSAGAILTAEAAVRFKQLGLPLPGALGIFSGLADYSRAGDSHLMYTLPGLPGEFDVVDPAHPNLDAYVGKTDPRDPVLSPLFADLKGMPPTLLVTSTRDILLSGTTIFHRALLGAGVDADLVVFEVLPHAFWYHFELPETTECLNLMAKYFDRKLEH
jgi:monoterpene epsilon-lactone hydrolase